MPTYEMSLLVRKMGHPATVAALKRAAGEVYSSGGFIRWSDNPQHNEPLNLAKIYIKQHLGTCHD